MVNHWTNWLEQKWVTPAYAGWVLMVVSVCFFGAAINTLAGWLYVLSAMGIVLLIVSAILPVKSLQALSVEHLPTASITQGEDLQIQLLLYNRSAQPQRLVQIVDHLPQLLGDCQPLAIEWVPPQGSQTALLTCRPHQRGRYQWEKLELRSGQPLGLFWCRRIRRSPTQVYVYPAHLRLTHCPILDHWQQSEPAKREAQQRPQLSTWGTTRSLRPYRTGDPLRLIHWRSSARYGQFQVRELEMANQSQVVTICLDANSSWEKAAFEQAVVATCSLYFYARQQQQLEVRVWTSSHGLLGNQQAILQALAEVQPADTQLQPPSASVLWVSNRTANLPPGSRSLLWGQSQIPGITIQPGQPLLGQLQKSIYL